MGGDRKGRNGKGTHSGLDPVPLLFCGSTPMCSAKHFHHGSIQYHYALKCDEA